MCPLDHVWITVYRNTCHCCSGVLYQSFLSMALLFPGRAGTLQNYSRKDLCHPHTVNYGNKCIDYCGIIFRSVIVRLLPIVVLIGSLLGVITCTQPDESDGCSFNEFRVSARSQSENCPRVCSTCAVCY